MNNKKFKYLLKHPSDIDALSVQQLDEVITEYPYFQAARAIQLKGLNKINSFKYNQALKKTAAHTLDRKVLFDFITSFNFTNKRIKEIIVLEEIEVIGAETINETPKKSKVSPVQPLVDPKKEIVQKKEMEKPTDNFNVVEQTPNEVLEIGKPLQFNNTEPHSFNEWMQLISTKPIEREEKTNKKIEKSTKTEDKFSLIDTFIKTNPKIKLVDKNAINVDISIESSYENESLMTETLAKVYLEQKKYENAIKAYRILSLKYPEKSGFFADRIKAIKILQKNKS